MLPVPRRRGNDRSRLERAHLGHSLRGRLREWILEPLSLTDRAPGTLGGDVRNLTFLFFSRNFRDSSRRLLPELKAFADAADSFPISH